MAYDYCFTFKTFIMEKKFYVDVDITMSKRIYVDAENEEEARKIANESVKKEAFYYARHADAYVFHEITDIYEDK